MVPSFGFRYEVVGDELIGFHSISPALQIVAVSGERNSIPVPGAGRPLTEEMKSMYEAAVRADYAVNGAHYEGPLDSYFPKAYAPVAPSYTVHKISETGDVWMARWDPSSRGGGQPMTWDIVKRDGLIRASITLPLRSNPMWIGERQVLIIQRDSLDVAYVQLFDIVRDSEDSR